MMKICIPLKRKNDRNEKIFVNFEKKKVAKLLGYWIKVMEMVCGRYNAIKTLL